MRVLNLFIGASKENHLIAMAKRKVTVLRMQSRPLSFLATSPISQTSMTVDRQRIPMLQLQPIAVNFPLTSHFCKSQQYCDDHSNVLNAMSETQYEALAEETLNSLHDFFDVLPDLFTCTDEYDSELGNGVLTIRFNSDVGTYVINKQTPNKQIWLSSPKTGPKRYDFFEGKWVYRHDGVGLHHLLEEEISEIFGSQVSLKDCKHYS